MNSAACYHRPESEMAYLYDDGHLHIRFQSAKDDLQKVEVIWGDPYRLLSEKWYLDAQPMAQTASSLDKDFYQIAIQPPLKRLAYLFKLTDTQGQVAYYTEHGIFAEGDLSVQIENLYFRLPFLHDRDAFKAPQWVKETVWYQIFPERFANGNPANDPEGTLTWDSQRKPGYKDFFGGDLQGIMDKLDYLSDLGVNGLYLCPIFKASSNHKYDTIDYFDIDPAFGDKKLLKQLITACHQRGIKVMLDAVFNHIGEESPQWQDVLEKGEESRYKDWFHIEQFPPQVTRSKRGHVRATYHMFAQSGNLPKLNTANPEVKAYLLEVAKYWIEVFDIDAWRLDVANEIDHAFWKDFRKVCDAAKKDFYIVGEIWHSAQKWLEGDECHAVMNYAYTDSILSHYLYHQIGLNRMLSQLAEHQQLYREQANQVMFNLPASHDTPRLLHLCGNNKELMKFVLTFIFLQQGSPAVYYGDEVGLTGGADPDCRRCMAWLPENQDLELLAFYKALIAFRKSYADVISFGKRSFELVDEEKGLLSFVIQYGDERLSCIFNEGKTHDIAAEHAIMRQNYINGKLEKHGFLIYQN